MAASLRSGTGCGGEKPAAARPAAWLASAESCGGGWRRLPLAWRQLWRTGGGWLACLALAHRKQLAASSEMAGGNLRHRQ